MEFNKSYTATSEFINVILNNVQNFIYTVEKFDKGYKYNIDIEKVDNVWIANMKVYGHTPKHTEEVTRTS